MNMTISTGLMSVPVANQVHRDYDPWVVAVTKGLNEVCGFAPVTFVSDLLAEVVSLAGTPHERS